MSKAYKMTFGYKNAQNNSGLRNKELRTRKTRKVFYDIPKRFATILRCKACKIEPDDKDRSTLKSRITRKLKNSRV